MYNKQCAPKNQRVKDMATANEQRILVGIGNL